MGNQRAVKLADRLSGRLHLSPPAGRRVGRQGQSLLGPPACLPERAPAVTLPPLGFAGQGAAGPAAHWPAATTAEHIHHPRRLPTRRQGPAGIKCPAPRGPGQPSRPWGGVGCPAAAPSPLKTAPSHGHLGPLRTRLWGEPGCSEGQGCSRRDLPPGTQEPATATPETRGSTQTRLLGTSHLSLLGATHVTPGPAPHPGWCRAPHPPPQG